MSEESSVEVESTKQSLDLIAQLANQLVAENTEFRQLVASMLASRQLYAMCAYELEWLLREDTAEIKEVASLTEPQKVMLKEVLINAAAVQAQQPFDENDLFYGMKQIVFPWMEKVVVKHSAAQEKARKKFAEQQEKMRIETLIDVGYGISDGPLARHNSIVLVGETRAINFVLDKIVARVTSDGSTVRQVVDLGESSRLEPSSRLALIRKAGWKNCANSNSGFRRVYAAAIEHQLSNPVDLIIVRDLTWANDAASFSLTTRANEAQRKFKNWAKEAGALLIGCLPLDRPLRDNELHQPEYESLRVHNHLRGVQLIPVENSTLFDVRVGTQIVAQFDPHETTETKIHLD